MNKSTRDILISKTYDSNALAFYRQDPKLVAAIDKLFRNNHQEETGIVLPDRKLNFVEVQQILNRTACNERTIEINQNNYNKNNKAIIKKIEEFLSDINATADSGETPTLIIRNQRLWTNCIYDLDRVSLKSVGDAKTSTISYSRGDKTRFNAIVFVLTKIHELLLKGLTVTRRELFYQNIAKFRNQAILDVAVRDVCCLLEHPPWHLGIVATAKGLIAGPLKMYYKNGSVVDCMTSGGVLMPQDINAIREFKSTAKYILVVEKDAIFQKLIDEGALVRLGPVVIITGKGYPDVCTRRLLCRLVAELKLKALALVDADPHGYEIFLTYKHGSLAQSHLSANLACTSLRLLGVRPTDVSALAARDSRLALTTRDRRKLCALLNRPYLNTPTGIRIKEDLKVMLNSGVKAEIEAVAPTAAALCDSYLTSKIIQADYC